MSTKNGVYRMWTFDTAVRNQRCAEECERGGYAEEVLGVQRAGGRIEERGGDAVEAG
ncbi:hypothetical protein ACHAPF_007325 [Botrytis cinerea]